MECGISGSCLSCPALRGYLVHKTVAFARLLFIFSVGIDLESLENANLDFCQLLIRECLACCPGHIVSFQFNNRILMLDVHWFFPWFGILPSFIGRRERHWKFVHSHVGKMIRLTTTLVQILWFNLDV